MFSVRCAVIMVLALAVILSAGNAYSNGINPPRPSSATTVKSICKESSGGRVHEIFRTQIMGIPESADSLSFVIGGAEEQIDITAIRTIALKTGGVDQGGFIEGTLIRSDGTEEKTVKVRVKTNNTVISVTGFRENNTRVTIDLINCKSIEFSSMATPSGSYKPVMKKKVFKD